MKHYKYNSNPLIEVSPGLGEYSYDEYGNFVLFDMVGNSSIVIKTVLDDDVKITNYENPKVALKGFWAATTKELKKRDHGIKFDIHSRE